MASPRVTRGLLLLLIVALLAIVPIGASAQTEGDVDRAEGQVDQAKGNTSQAYTRWQQAQDDLEAAILELDIVTSQLENLVYTIGLTESRIVTYEDEVSSLKDNAQQLFLEAYTSGGRGMVSAAFEAGTIQDLLTSQQLMNNAATRDCPSWRSENSSSRSWKMRPLASSPERRDSWLTPVQPGNARATSRHLLR